MNTSTPTIIFSVYRAEISAGLNAMAVSRAKAVLKKRGIPYFKAIGCYKGQQEPAFVLQDVADNLAIVQKLATWYKQESILLIDANRQARLETVDGELIESLGQFRETRKGIAEQRDSWTECHGRYWIAA